MNHSSFGPLKIILIENPFQNWNHALVPDLYKNIISLKRAGYEGVYASTFIPMDTADLVATHHLICEETKKGFLPIAGYRTITYDQCVRHQLPFPGTAKLENAIGTELHKLAGQRIMSQALSEGKTVSYGSGFTVHPKYRKDRESVEFLKDLVRAMMVSYPLANGIDEEVGISAPKVKTDRYFWELGYEFVKHEGQELPTFGHREMGNEPVFYIHRRHFTPFALEALKRHQDLINQQIHIKSEPSKKTETA